MSRKKYERIDWSEWDHLLGILVDQELADMIGCDRTTVAFRRKRLGIAPFIYAKPENPIIECACGCGGLLYRYDNRWREREYLPSHWSRTQERIGNHERWGKRGSHLKYPQEFFDIRDSVLERDGFRCQLCSELSGASDLAIHHIDYDPSNNDPSNLVSLCFKCHAKTNTKRDEWQRYFADIGDMPDIESHVSVRKRKAARRRSKRQADRRKRRRKQAADFIIRQREGVMTSGSEL